ncbi:hypothetical protein BVC80_1729g2 [Macleaya cordata]|uniref:Uncharacterized protein n=1 Tax=Macleaya cordata TaxID=56857 RepID=A0A200QC98_MACCD|nr:hypothetical protein BVC80_1729g2 [Macleaya cordata]
MPIEWSGCGIGGKMKVTVVVLRGFSKRKKFRKKKGLWCDGGGDGDGRRSLLATKRVLELRCITRVVGCCLS